MNADKSVEYLVKLLNGADSGISGQEVIAYSAGEIVEKLKIDQNRRASSTIGLARISTETK